MFYYLTGELVHVGENLAVIDCGGVGFRLTVSATTLSLLPRTTGEGNIVRLYTHLAVREDALDLYGFYTKEELNLFRMLTNISGIGPKVAISVLSLLTPDALAEAVASQNVKLISRAPGVGMKTAQRIVLELSGKLAPIVSPATGVNVGTQSSASMSSSMSEALDALVVLGYSRQEAQKAIRAVPDAAEKSTEELIKAALSHLL